MAVEAGTDPALVEMLLKHGADVNARDDKGITVLMKANERLVPLLLRHGAALNRQDARGNMALHHAVWSATDRNYTDSAVKLLLQRHANFRLKNRYGETPRGMLPKRKKFKGRYAFRDYPEDVMEILEKAGVRE